MDPQTPKQIVVIRKDLKMRRGKECAQAAHASALWLIDLYKHDMVHSDYMDVPENDWLLGDFTKVVCQVDTEAELLALEAAAQNAGLNAYHVVDKGATEFNGVPTITALAIGPDRPHRIDPITSHLKLY